MIPAGVVSFLAPKVVKFVLKSVVSMNAPMLKGITGSLADFVNDKYLQNKDFIAKAVSDVFPGEQFDGMAVAAVEKLIELALKEAAKFVDAEVTKLKTKVMSEDEVDEVDEEHIKKVALQKLAAIEKDLVEVVTVAAIDEFSKTKGTGNA